MESTNKVVENILIKIMGRHRHDLAENISKFLWAYKNTWWKTTRFSLFELMYGKSPIFPIEFEIKTLKMALEVGWDLTTT